MSADPMGRSVMIDFRPVDLHLGPVPRQPRDPTLFVFTDADQVLAAYGVGGFQPVPRFPAEILVVVHRGLCRTGGYRVEVKGIQQSGTEVAVRVELRDPAGEEFVTLALTYPLAAAVIERQQFEPRGPLLFLALDANGQELGRAGTEI